MNGLEVISAALARLRQESQSARDPHQRRRLQGIEKAIRRALRGEGDVEESTEGGTA